MPCNARIWSKLVEMRSTSYDRRSTGGPGDGFAQARAANLDHIEKVLRGIKAMMMRSAEYVAAKRDWLRRAHESGEFDTIEKFGIKLDLFLGLTAPPGQ